MAQQIVGYTQDGSPLYENVPDGQPPLVAGEEPLPPMNNGMTLDQLDAMSQGSGIDMRRDDLAAASGEVPQQVADDVAQSNPEVRRAETALQNEGSYFDLSYIEQMRNAYQQALQQSGGDQQKAAAMVKPVWNSFTPVQKHVYQQAEGFASLDPKFAAGMAVKYHEEQKRAQDEQQKMANNPRDQAMQQANVDKVRAAYDSNLKVQQTLDRLNGTTIDAKGDRVEPASPRWQPYVGKSSVFNSMAIPGTDRRQFGIDLQTLKDQLGLAARGSLKGQGQVSDMETKMLLNAAAAGLDPSGTEESFGLTYKQIQQYNNEQMNLNKGLLDRMEGRASGAASPSPSAAPSMPQTDTRKRTTLMGTKYAVNPDGTLQKVSQ
jgi:hypothetical protein